MYFDDSSKVVAINALREGDKLQFEGPFPIRTLHIRDRLVEQDRLVNPTIPALREGGVKRFCWLLPQENFSNACLLGCGELSQAIDRTAKAGWHRQYGVVYVDKDSIENCMQCGNDFMIDPLGLPSFVGQFKYHCKFVNLSAWVMV